MKHLSPPRYLFIILIAILFFGCEKPEDNIQNGEQDLSLPGSSNQMKSGEPDGYTILGAHIDVPYKVSVMAQAKENLISRNVAGASSISVRTSHKYIRFLPKDKEELDKLMELELILFDIPLDYEIVGQGTSFHDPTVSDSIPTPQYTVVDPLFTYSDVAWELLENAYIPEDDPALVNDSILVRELIIEAFKITNNEKYLDEMKGLLPSKWRPKGRIRVWDDVMGGLIPIKNCQVRSFRFFKIGIGYTDANGYYSCSERYRYNVHYSIRWEHPNGFRICDGFNWVTAKYDGPYIRDDWNCDIGGASSTYKNMRFATMFRAANRYFNENRGGLDSPKLLISLDMTYKHSQGSGLNIGNLPYTLIAISQIKVWGKDNNGDFRNTENVFSTTIHEIGHSAHWKKMGMLNFAQTTEQIRESWANALEWWLTRLEYSELGIPYTVYDNYSPTNTSNEGFNDWDQQWKGIGNTDKVYTPLFIDLVDDLNQSNNIGTPSYAILPSDRCPGDPWFDGANCVVGTPPAGTTAFIYNDNFYYTPIGCCTCPLDGSGFDDENCYVKPIPADRIGFIYNNTWYLHPLGDPTLPFDVIHGYTMEGIENNIIPHAFGLTSTRTAIKNNLPPGMTAKRIDQYLDFYFAL